jgi:hypothetical protein
LRMGRKLDRFRPSIRIMLEHWLVEAALSQPDTGSPLRSRRRLFGRSERRTKPDGRTGGRSSHNRGPSRQRVPNPESAVSLFARHRRTQEVPTFRPDGAPSLGQEHLDQRSYVRFLVAPPRSLPKPPRSAGRGEPSPFPSLSPSYRRGLRSLGA